MACPVDLSATSAKPRCALGRVPTILIVGSVRLGVCDRDDGAAEDFATRRRPGMWVPSSRHDGHALGGRGKLYVYGTLRPCLDTKEPKLLRLERALKGDGGMVRPAAEFADQFAHGDNGCGSSANRLAHSVYSSPLYRTSQKAIVDDRPITPRLQSRPGRGAHMPTRSWPPGSTPGRIVGFPHAFPVGHLTGSDRT